MELWTALNSCLWSCVVQSGAEEVSLDGRTFRVIRLVGTAYARWIGTNLLQLIAGPHTQTKQMQLSFMSAACGGRLLVCVLGA